MIRILLPTDFSSNANNAIDYAISFFNDDEKCRFILLHVNKVEVEAAGVTLSNEEIVEEDVDTILSETVKEIKHKFAKRKLNIESLVVTGHPVNEIEKVAERENVSFIVMGTKGASGLKGILVGSNTADVLRHVACPMIAVPENARFNTPRRIVFAADYLEIDENKLKPLVDVALMHHAQILILNVLRKEEITSVDDALQGLRLHHVLDEVEHSFHFIEDSNIVEGIDRFLSNLSVDMLAMVPRKNNFFDRLFHISATRAMALHTDIPLLAIHE